jgi:hypothetical protein
MAQQDLDYHRERARAEMDMACRAELRSVADAHMKLAALHMGQIKRQDELCGGSGFAARR